MQNNTPQDEDRRGIVSRVSLVSLVAAFSILCVMLGITRQSLSVSIAVVCAMMSAIGCLFVRQLRGELVILLMVVAPLAVIGLMYLAMTFLG